MGFFSENLSFTGISPQAVIVDQESWGRSDFLHSVNTLAIQSTTCLELAGSLAVTEPDISLRSFWSEEESEC